MILPIHLSQNGGWEILNYEVVLTQNEYNSYLNKLINRVFAILGVYEDCYKKQCFDDYFTYLNRLCMELKGCTFSIKKENILSLYNVLVGMSCSDVMEHKQVKSTVFHCISVIKKMRVVEDG